MEDKKFDKLIREKVQHSTLQPDSRTWETISGHLVRQRRIKGVLWFMAALAAITIGAVAYFQNDKDSTTALQQSNSAPELYQESNAQSSAQLPNESAATESHSVAQDIAGQAESNSTRDQAKKSSASQATSDGASHAAGLPISKKESKHEIPVAKDTKVASYAQRNDKSTRNDAHTGTEPVQDMRTQMADKFSSSLISQSDSKSTKPSEIMVYHEAERTAAIEDQFRVDYTTLVPRLKVAETGMLQTGLMSSLKMEDNDHGLRLFDYSGVECTDFRKRKRTLSLDLFVDGVMANAYYSSDEEYEEPRTIRQRTESNQSGYGFGMRLSYDVNRDISLRSGLTYTRVNENFFLIEREVIDRHISEIRIDSMIDPTTMEVTVTRDTIYTDQVETTTYQHENQYEFLDIPIEVGYNWAWKKWNVGLYGGAVFNLAFDKKGVLINEENEIVTFDGSDDSIAPQYDDRLGIMLTAAAQVSYHINQDFSFFIEPHTRYTLDPITVRNAPVEKRFQLLGLRIGTQVRL